MAIQFNFKNIWQAHLMKKAQQMPPNMSNAT